VSSGISFSGFNNIDFGTILNAVMRQESQPLFSLQAQQTGIKSKIENFRTLTTRLTALEDAAAALSRRGSLTPFAARSSDATAVAATGTSSAIPGRYEVVVNQLARAQVTASGTAPDANTTVIASGGTLTIGSQTLTLAGDTTMRGLAEQINAMAESPARASVVQSAPGAFRLVLTAKDTGAANGFTVTNGMTGGSGLAFTDTDGDGVTGNSPADNAVQALDADLLVNNIQVTSASNTLTNAVPGTTLTLYRQDPLTPIVVDVAADTEAFKDKVKTYVAAYNELTSFMTAQQKAAGEGSGSSIGNDPVMRQVRNQIRSSMTSLVGTSTSFDYLSQVGLGFTRAGKLELNETAFNAAYESSPEEVVNLFAGTGPSGGAFGAIKTAMASFTGAGGLLNSVQKSLTNRMDRIDDQITNMQERLAVRRAALQQEYLAAESAMTLLNNQSGSLSNLGA
jgi:flagellar hook-associated protein 2